MGSPAENSEACKLLGKNRTKQSYTNTGTITPCPSHHQDNQREEEAEAISLARTDGSKEDIEMWPDSEYIPKSEPRAIDNALEERS